MKRGSRYVRWRKETRGEGGKGKGGKGKGGKGKGIRKKKEEGVKKGDRRKRMGQGRKE